jgi:hypothetical protein
VEGVRTATSGVAVLTAVAASGRRVQRVRLLAARRSGFLRRSGKNDGRIARLRTLAVALAADLFDHERHGDEGGLGGDGAAGVAELVAVVVLVEQVLVVGLRQPVVVTFTVLLFLAFLFCSLLFFFFLFCSLFFLFCFFFFRILDLTNLVSIL